MITRKTLISSFAASVLCYGPLSAGTDFGTRADAQVIADQVIRRLDEGGLQSTIEAMFYPALPFASSPMGVNLFAGSVVVGDNREPEMVEADYAEASDLTGALVWPLVDAAADAREDVILRWYHYETQEVYDYHCLCARAKNRLHTIMVCR